MRKNKKIIGVLGTNISNLLFSWRYMWRHSPRYAVLRMISTIMEGVNPPAQVLLSALLFNKIDEGTDFATAVGITLCILALTFAYNLWGYIFDYSLEPRLKKRLQFKIQSDLLKKARKIELSRYDEPDFYDDFLAVIQNADAHISEAVEIASSVVSGIFTILATIGLFSYVSPLVMIIMVASSFLSLFLSMKKKRLNYEAYLKSLKYQKREQYIDRLFRLPEFAKELRIGENGAATLKAYEDNTGLYAEHEKKRGRKLVGLNIAESLNFYITFLLLLILTVYRVAVQKTLLIGGFAVIVNANWRFRNAINSFVNTISDIPMESRCITKIRDFLGEKGDTVAGLECGPFENITLKNVMFSYVDGKNVLKGVDLRINKGEHVAIVGCNGAGKSTLIKLILGFYHPQSGEVLYNGINLEKLNREEYRKRFGAAFQDFQIFAVSMAENVCGGVFADSDREAVKNTLSMATFEDELKKLNYDINVPMTREFDENGIILSGGGMQKIAIARALYQDAEIIVMDEPSASLDAISEDRLISNVKSFCGQKTLITITHRLSMTRNADKIYVLDAGRIVEAGNHEELMRLRGKYAELFELQAGKYKGRNLIHCSKDCGGG